MKSRSLLKAEDSRSVVNQGWLSTSSLVASVHGERWGATGLSREGRISSGSTSTEGLDVGELGPACCLTEAGVTLPTKEEKKAVFLISTQSLQNQKFWGWSPAACALTSPPGVSDASESLVVVPYYPALGSSEEGRQKVKMGLKYTNKTVKNFDHLSVMMFTHIAKINKVDVVWIIVFTRNLS